MGTFAECDESIVYAAKDAAPSRAPHLCARASLLAKDLEAGIVVIVPAGDVLGHRDGTAGG